MKQFVCPKCNKSFKYKTGLEWHLSNTHKKRSRVTREKPTVSPESQTEIAPTITNTSTDITLMSKQEDVSLKMLRLEESLNLRMSETERAVWENTFISKINIDDSSDDDFTALAAKMCIGGYVLGFQPSECFNSLSKTGLLSNAVNPGYKNELKFWFICWLLSRFVPDTLSNIGRDESKKFLGDLDINEIIETALTDTLFPRKMAFALLQLKLSICVNTAAYQQALDTLRDIETRFQTTKAQACTLFWDGYIHALMDNNINVDLRFLINLHIPENEFEEFIPTQSETQNIPIVSSHLEVDVAIAKSIVDQIKETISQTSRDLTLAFMNTAQQKDEYVKEITVESIRSGLIKEFGNWVEQLCNPGAIINAEFLFENLNKRTWGEVVAGYCNCLESEIRSKLINPLEQWLMIKRKSNKIFDLKSTSASIEVNSNMKINDFRTILSELATNGKLQDIKDYLVSFIPSNPNFIQKELPEAIKTVFSGSLRDPSAIRNPSTHGNIVTVEKARQTREIIIGSSKTPGILRTLCELKEQPGIK